MKAFHSNRDGTGADDRPSELTLSHWGKEDCAPRHSFGPGVRDVYKVHFVHRGRGKVRVGGHEYGLAAGDAFLIYPQVVIQYEADETDPWTYSWVGFRGDRMADWLARTRLTPENPVFAMDVSVMPTLYERLTEADAREESRDMRIASLLYRFMAALIEAAPASAPGTLSPRKHPAHVHRAMEFVHAHYGEPISVSGIASELGLDRKYLSAIFKAATGSPPQRYLLEYRIRQSCKLLKESGLQVGEVARSVGYEDALLFSKMFRKVTGVSPTEYRSEEQERSDFIP
ncbi:AraC family transcriptional regulator [Cohnella zeiphila]|uniref:AraC family transcriptional regulator n=1 Tax=Cohnella zeiphila TaxID=2761120 RepID=A0A7X0SM70_9BACL|nr:AraC family transcriptional regulator [Cohnella zeiphila]MBB6731250.1 AraC family transcriptional regulator [Cohnella zeiphila]